MWKHAQHGSDVTKDAPMTAPEQIGRYRVTGELGRGGMGVVYRGEDRLIGREVAIKTLTEATPELRERFFIEARSGILSHPNIVTVYELGEHEGSPFIAMEFVGGESLEKLLRTRKRLPLLEALSIMEQLCSGLGHAHGHGVVHRDVKPANILVRPDGRVTIVDFGIARLADQTRQLTRADALLGTFHYIAPERLKGEVSDGRGDVWSAGVILYEMLTGELPFKGDDVSSLYRVIHESYVPLTEYVQDLPEGLSSVLAKALAKRVEDRYRTAEEVSFDLQVIAEGLKHDRVNTLLATARRLTEETQFASARTVLLQAQRIDPGNADAKLLIHEVQDRLSQLQRGEQLRQIVEQAQDALGDRRWDDAIVFFQQAAKLDVEETLGLAEHLQNAHEQKQQQQRVVALWEQAREARGRGDLTQAQAYLTQALEIDERNTDLRNAHSVVLREIERRQKGLQVEELLRSARESYGVQQYTEAIAHLRRAAEFDPTRTEVQQLLFTVVTRQKEERRQQLLEKIVTEIQESLDREDFTLALDRTVRALETLPGDGLLLRLKTEAESKKHDFEVEQIVRKTMLEVQDLFAEDPAQALAAVEQGLQNAPESDTLKQSRSRLRAHLQELEIAAARAEALVMAHAAMEQRDFVEARHVLEAVLGAHGAIEDLSQLLAVAKSGQEKADREAAALREAQEARDATERAVAAFKKSLAAGDLRRCMRPLEEIGSCNGEEESIRDAILSCETKRNAAAEKSLVTAVESARRLVTQGKPKQAMVLLRRAEFATPFATPSLRHEYDRVKAECATAARLHHKDRPLRTLLHFDRTRRYVVYALALCIALGVVALVRSHHPKSPAQASVAQPVAPQTAPVPHVVEQTDMEINATPWAKILRIEDENGKTVPLPGDSSTTPLRLEHIALGKYTLTLTTADGEQHTTDCRVSHTEHLCAAVMDPIDVQQLLTGDHL